MHQIKAPHFYTDLGLQKTVLNPHTNGKIQGLFKAFECFSSTIQDKFYFQGLFKTVLYSSTFQACANSEGEIIMAVRIPKAIHCIKCNN